MAPDTDLRAELAPLFDDEPPGFTVQDFVAGGRTRLRRRRFGQGLGAVVVVVAVATGFAAASGGLSAERSLVTDSSGADDPRLPEPTATTTYDSADTQADEDRIRGFHVDKTDGEVTAVAGGEVLAQLQLGDISADAGAVAVDVVLDGDETWWYVDWSKDSEGTTNVAASQSQPFSEWAQRMHAQQNSDGAADPLDSPTDLVSTDQYGHPEILPGVEVLQRIDNPFGLQAPYTSVALEVRQGDQHVLAVMTPSSGSFGDPTKETLQELIDEFREGGPGYTANGPMPPIWSVDGPGMPSLAPGVEVVRKVANPLGVERPRQSVAYVVRFDGKTWWTLWELGPSGLDAAQTIRVANDGYATFEAWLADQKVQVEW